MIEFLSQLTTIDIVALLLGLSLLVFGRRLYWIALGGLGFFTGLWLCGHFLSRSSTGLELGIAFLVAVLGAWFAIWAQKMAIGVGGFILGGAGGFWLATSILAPTLQWQMELGIWIVTGAGAIFGVFVGALLFDATLIFLSSLVGAYLMASRSDLGHPRDLWLLLILLCVGILLQSRRSTEDEPKSKD